ncbi:hypothetical protein [Streptomyces sp. NPDC089915]|uniref:hypothetical protein n=1 Tax=Streptomyces sp. NPDC089915 TaxID=3155186 RepID=UPI003424BD4B
MFIRPVNVTVTAATRPPGRPLLRGLLRRAAGAAEWSQDVDGEGLAESFAEDEAEALTEAEALAEAEGLAEAAGTGLEARAEAVDEADAMARPSPWPPAPPGTPAPRGTLVSELTQLADLAREGLLTPEEFARAKSRLLEG